ncbi:hypothetical protein QJS10_CPA10g01454 [Acorus calamus]|uniref:Uncharacterized protein n=1 Tax=Acorus calamus TaxID=4465 RepID=A0AAV9E070_ACOCL|nr:hypothetical protein QJS10_CPA10g01454 [Acorus calamus]
MKRSTPIDLTSDGGVTKTVVRSPKSDAVAPSDSLSLVDGKEHSAKTMDKVAKVAKEHMAKIVKSVWLVSGVQAETSSASATRLIFRRRVFMRKERGDERKKRNGTFGFTIRRILR